MVSSFCAWSALNLKQKAEETLILFPSATQLPRPANDRLAGNLFISLPFQFKRCDFATIRDQPPQLLHKCLRLPSQRFLTQCVLTPKGRYFKSMQAKLRRLSRKRPFPMRRPATVVLPTVIGTAERLQIEWLKLGRFRNERLFASADQGKYYCFHNFFLIRNSFSIGIVARPTSAT